MKSTDQVRQEIVEYGASLFARGFTVGTSGNMSARIEGGYLMTPTNRSLGDLDPDELSLLDEEWNHIGGLPPSKEVVMHRAVYEARPETGAVVHLHSTNVTALSCLVADGPLLVPHTPYLVMRMGAEIPRVPYFRPGDPAMNDSIFEAASRGKAVILDNHGSLVAGRDLADAVSSAEELEASSELALLLQGRNSRPLTDQEISELLS